MQLTQSESNRILIRSGWVLVAVNVIGMIVCLGLWAVGVLSNEVVDVITNVLSWLAMVGTGCTFLLQAYTKRDVDC